MGVRDWGNGEKASINFKWLQPPASGTLLFLNCFCGNKVVDELFAGAKNWRHIIARSNAQFVLHFTHAFSLHPRFRIETETTPLCWLIYNNCNFVRHPPKRTMTFLLFLKLQRLCDRPTGPISPIVDFPLISCSRWPSIAPLLTTSRPAGLSE